MKDFEKELTELINRHSMENGSNTPDFILAEFLRNCLVAFNNTATRRDEWYGPVPGEDPPSAKAIWEKRLGGL